jgi:hypothetical protein
LPAVTPDVRCVSRAVRTGIDNAGARALVIDGARVLYRQGSLHGAPCFPDSFDDVSLRTPDVRDPDWRVGHHHPRTLVAYLPPPDGFFVAHAPAVNWSEPQGARFGELIEVFDDQGCTVYRNRSLHTRAFVPVRIRRRVQLGTPPGLHGAPAPKAWRFEGLVFDNTVEVFEGRVSFVQCAVRSLDVHSVDRHVPTLTAADSLLQRVHNARGLTQLVYCTVLGDCVGEALQASDCIFEGALHADLEGSAPPRHGCVRFSRLPPAQAAGGMALHAVTRDRVAMLRRTFGQPGCAVLHPSNPPSIARGAEDEGELGAHHHRQYLRALSAMQQRCAEFMPVGMRAAITYDDHMTTVPAASG